MNWLQSAMTELGKLLMPNRTHKMSLNSVDSSMVLSVWQKRVLDLVIDGRANEVSEMRNLMYRALSTPFVPSYPTLHEFLSQILLSQKQYDAALQETDYALQLMANDIVLQHRKGLILTSLHRLSEAKTLIDNLISRYPDLNTNAEIAGLEGRIYRELWETQNNPQHLDHAIDAYGRAFNEVAIEYFPAINVAELLLIKGDQASIDRAQKILASVRDVCSRLIKESQVSYWVDFTLGEAYLGLDELDRGPQAYKQALSRSPAPSDRDWESAMKGMVRMVNIKRISQSIADQIQGYRPS